MLTPTTTVYVMLNPSILYHPDAYIFNDHDQHTTPALKSFDLIHQGITQPCKAHISEPIPLTAPHVVACLLPQSLTSIHEDKMTLASVGVQVTTTNCSFPTLKEWYDVTSATIGHAGTTNGASAAFKFSVSRGYIPHYLPFSLDPKLTPSLTITTTTSDHTFFITFAKTSNFLDNKNDNTTIYFVPKTNSFRATTAMLPFYDDDSSEELFKLASPQNHVSIDIDVTGSDVIIKHGDRVLKTLAGEMSSFGVGVAESAVDFEVDVNEMSVPVRWCLIQNSAGSKPMQFSAKSCKKIDNALQEYLV